MAVAAVVVLGHPVAAGHASSVAAPAPATATGALAPGWKPKNPKPSGDERSAYEPDHEPGVMDGHLINPDARPDRSMHDQD
jgi:hypothetical protein